jgi:phage/plasmid-like protein (TIGR03299 family)
MIPTTVRVVCQNTLNLALREAGVEGLTISHHPRLESRIAEARAKLGIIAARFDKFDDELHAMLAKELTVTEAGGYFRGLTGADLPHGTDRQKKTREKVFGQMLDNFDNDRNTLPGVKHTAWGAYNAVSEWADHQRKYRGASPADKLDRQLDSVWFGQSHQLKQARIAERIGTGGRSVGDPSPNPSRCAWSAGAGWGAVVNVTPPNISGHLHKGDSSWPATTE